MLESEIIKSKYGKNIQYTVVVGNKIIMAAEKKPNTAIALQKQKLNYFNKN